MEPIPETTEAVEEFGPFYEGDVLEELRAKAQAVRQIVPDCIGLSVAALDQGITLTLVASDEEIAALDALQYLADGPCVRGVEANRVVEFTSGEATDEADWQLFAQGTAAAGVASTLTLPVMVGESAVGSVNLYAASAEAFTGHHEEVAAVLGAWAPGAITNADLGFATRQRAELTARELRESFRIEVAAGILARLRSLDAASAHERLVTAARRAGVSVAQVAETLIALVNENDGG